MVAVFDIADPFGYCMLHVATHGTVLALALSAVFPSLRPDLLNPALQPTRRPAIDGKTPIPSPLGGALMSTTKATVAATESAGTADAPRPSRSVRALAVLGATAATLTVWAIAGPLAGIGLRVRLGSATVQHVGPAPVAIVSILAGLAAWGLLAALERFTPRARMVWTAIALATLALSLAGPLSSGVSTATKMVLASMHLAAAAVLLPLLTGRAIRRPSPGRAALRRW